MTVETPAEFVDRCEDAIKTGLKQEALDSLQALSFYLSYGAIAKTRLNRLCRIYDSRFGEEG